MCTPRLFKFLAVMVAVAGLTFSSARAQPEADSLRKYYGDANPCQQNVACDDGRPWFNEIGAVARVVPHPFLPTVGRGCTGTFVNNVDEDLTPYFLSAAHCIGGDIGQVLGFAYQFYWQTPGCTNPPDPPEFTYIISPAELEVEGLETNGQDYALQRVYVADTTLANRMVHFAGWSIDDDLPTQGVLIGHPQGDVKKIVLGEEVNPVTFTDSTWALDIATGAAEIGQSGSALFDEDHQIVGVTIHGGACAGVSTGNPKLEHFWDLDFWDPHGDTYVSLAGFIDPDDTGVTSLLPTANYDLVVSGETFSDPATDLASGFFRTAESITAENDTLLSGGRLHVRARESITITGDFLAEAGGDFLAQIDPVPGAGGGFARSGPEMADAPLPPLPTLGPNYPNPFRHQTTFRFSIPEPAHVTLTVYDLLGREVMTLLDQPHEAGRVTLQWVASDDSYRPLASGVYFYQLHVGDQVETGRMTFLGP